MIVDLSIQFKYHIVPAVVATMHSFPLSSGHVDTGVARRAWHRRHKARILDGEPEPEGQPAPIDPTDRG